MKKRIISETNEIALLCTPFVIMLVVAVITLSKEMSLWSSLFFGLIMLTLYVMAICHIVKFMLSSLIKSIKRKDYNRKQIKLRFKTYPLMILIPLCISSVSMFSVPVWILLFIILYTYFYIIMKKYIEQ